MIIFRYLSKEIFAALSAITGILLLIFISNEFVRYLTRAATGKFSGSTALQLIIIEIPHLLGILLPLGLFLGILFAYSRLYTDNEMTVLYACGLSRLKLLGLTLPVTGVVITVVALLSLWFTPHLLVYRERLLAESGTAMELETTLPGRFQENNNGQQIFYVESMTPDHMHMQNIFMAQSGDIKNNKNTPDNPAITPWIILTAANGYQTVDKKTGDRFFVATQGNRYQGVPGSKDFQIIQFGEYRARIEKHIADISGEQDAMSTFALLYDKKDRVDAASELQWRFSAPLSALLLALLAVPLSRVKPRQGKYAALLPAILIYIIYANLILVGRNWIEQGHISPALGLWWIHGLMFLGVILIWIYQTSLKTIRALFIRRLEGLR